MEEQVSLNNCILCIMSWYLGYACISSIKFLFTRKSCFLCMDGGFRENSYDGLLKEEVCSGDLLVFYVKWLGPPHVHWVMPQEVVELMAA